MRSHYPHTHHAKPAWRSWLIFHEFSLEVSSRLPRGFSELLQNLIQSYYFKYEIRGRIYSFFSGTAARVQFSYQYGLQFVCVTEYYCIIYLKNVILLISYSSMMMGKYKCWNQFLFYHFWVSKNSACVYSPVPIAWQAWHHFYSDMINISIIVSFNCQFDMS